MATAEIDLRAGLLERIQKLETQHNRWKLATLLLALVLASSLTIGLMSQEKIEPPMLRAKAVEAQSFSLKDASGM